MSGSLNLDNSSTINAIKGGFQPTQLENPADIFAKWQDLSNKKSQQQLINAQTANTQQNTTNQTLTNATQQNKNLAGVAVGGLALPDAVLADPNQVTGYLQNAVQTGGIDQNHASAFLQRYASLGPNPNPTAVRQLFQGAAIANGLDPSLQKYLPQTGPNINNGQTVQGSVQNPPIGPNPGGITPTGPQTPVGMPSQVDLITPYSWTGSDGLTKYGNVGSYNDALKNGTAKPGSGAPSSGGTGSNPGDYNQKPSTSPSGASSTPGVMSGPTIATQGQNDAAKSNMAASTARYNAVQGDVANITQNNQRVQQLLDSAEVNPTGPGADESNKAKEVLASVLRQAGQPVPPDLNMQSMAAALQTKDVAQLIANTGISAQSLGAMEQVAAGVPGTKVDTAAFRDGMLHIKANNTLTTLAYNQAGGDPTKFAATYANLAQNVDPKGLVWDVLSPAERKNELAKVGPATVDGKPNPAYASLKTAIAYASEQPGFNMSYKNQFNGLQPGSQPTPTNPGVQQPSPPVTPSTVSIKPAVKKGENLLQQGYDYTKNKLGLDQ